MWRRKRRTQGGEGELRLAVRAAHAAGLIPLPPGAIEPQGWLRDWCLTARDGYTGHMDDVAVPAGLPAACSGYTKLP